MTKEDLTPFHRMDYGVAWMYQSQFILRADSNLAPTARANQSYFSGEF